MRALFRVVVVASLVAAFIVGVAWLFCAGLSDIFPGETCGRVLRLVDWLMGLVPGIAGR